MPIIKGLEGTFDTVADRYEKLRPGYPKVYAMLKSGGAFARFDNHPYRDKGNPILSEEIEKCYAAYYVPYHGKDIKSEKEYVALLGTYSDHIVMEEKIRTEFFSKIEETINQYGGSFTLYDTIDLLLARKP